MKRGATHGKERKKLGYQICVPDYVVVLLSGGGARWRSGKGTTLQTGRSWVRFPMVSLDFFQLHNPSSRTMALGSTQPLTEMSTGRISWG
jgi:hypothetical protein